MRARLICICVAFLIIMACGKSVKPPKPDNLIPKEKMINVLKEMFIVNSAKGVNRRMLENKGLDPEQYILDRFSIDSAQFAESNNYYAHDMEEYQSIIETIKEDITKDLESLRAIHDEEKEAAKRRRDSLQQNKTPNPNIRELQQIED